MAATAVVSRPPRIIAAIEYFRFIAFSGSIRGRHLSRCGGKKRGIALPSPFRRASLTAYNPRTGVTDTSPSAARRTALRGTRPREECLSQGETHVRSDLHGRRLPCGTDDRGHAGAGGGRNSMVACDDGGEQRRHC